MPRLSVIVPVYKVEDYLPQCLHSLLTQAEEGDLEIVCVNDGSPDLSRAILGLFDEVSDRIVVVDKENGGLSSARNAGIEVATGDYVTFVDSDDFVEPSYAQCIEEALAPGDVDVLVFGARVWPESASYWWLDRVLSPRTCHYPGFCEALLADEGTRPFAWRLAVRRELLFESGLRFDEDLVFGEDQAFMLGLYPRARGISVISAKPYVYRADRAGSLMEGRFKDLALRSHDHVRIVEHVLRDWLAAGFIERWGREIFFWAIDFTVADILKLENPARSQMLVYLACVLETFFSEEDLDRWCAEKGTVAAFARAVLVDRTLSSGPGRKGLFYYHTITHEGIRPFVEGPVNRVLRSAPAQAIADTAAKISPALDAEAVAAHEALASEAERADALMAALAYLAERRDALGLEPIDALVFEEEIELASAVESADAAGEPPTSEDE